MLTTIFSQNTIIYLFIWFHVHVPMFVDRYISNNCASPSPFKSIIVEKMHNIFSKIPLGSYSFIYSEIVYITMVFLPLVEKKNELHDSAYTCESSRLHVFRLI